MPMANHRESWALENRSPKVLEAEYESAPVTVGGGTSSVSRPKKAITEREKFIAGMGNDENSNEQNDNINEETRSMTEGNEKEVLIVASKLKNYIRAKSGMNTSAAVTDILSEKVRELCDQAVEAAKRDGRKTVMDRDFL